MNKKVENPGYIVIHITAKDADEARKIAKALVKGRLAACVNILPDVESYFWWKDKLETKQEVLLIVKSKESLLPELIKSVKKNSSYAVPEIIALPVNSGSRDYLEWINAEVK